MTEKWKWDAHGEGLCDALLIDISKAFDCVVPDFLLVKLEACKFTWESLNVIKITFR